MTIGIKIRIPKILPLILTTPTRVSCSVSFSLSHTPFLLTRIFCEQPGLDSIINVT